MPNWQTDEVATDIFAFVLVMAVAINPMRGVAVFRLLLALYALGIAPGA
jgi:hypothetical protein